MTHEKETQPNILVQSRASQVIQRVFVFGSGLEVEQTVASTCITLPIHSPLAPTLAVGTLGRSGLGWQFF